MDQVSYGDQAETPAERLEAEVAEATRGGRQSDRDLPNHDRLSVSSVAYGGGLHMSSGTTASEGGSVLAVLTNM